MDENIVTSENTTFEYLRRSPDFLRAVLENISSCVLLLDADMRVRAFNDALRTIFSNRPNEHLLYRRCGEALGCAHHVDEGLPCGSTSRCGSCPLRRSAISTYTHNIPVYRRAFSRRFYTVDGEKQLKHLRFSTRAIPFDDGKYVFLTVDDITQLADQAQVIAEQRAAIHKLHQELESGRRGFQ